MTLALLLWAIAGGLTAAALTAMAALVVRRLIDGAGAGRRSQRMVVCRRVMTQAITGHVSVREDLQRLFGDNAPLAEALVELGALVRGDDRDRLLETMLRVGGLDRFARDARRGPKARRIICIEALSMFPLANCGPVLRDIMRHGDRNIRMAAVESLVEAGARITPAQLVQAAVGGELRLSLRYADLLKRLVIAEPQSAIRVLKRPALPLAFQCLLADALGHSGDYAAIGVLAEKARARSPELRAVAVRALGRLKHPIVEDTIIAALADGDWRVRCAAIRSVGLVKLERLYGVVAESLADDVWSVRYAAAATLASGGAPGRSMMDRTVDAGGDQGVRLLAMMALNESLAA